MAKTSTSRSGPRTFLTSLSRSRESSLFLIIVAAFLLLALLKGDIFLSLKNFEGIATGITYDLLMAAGMTVVLILLGIDLSVGAVLVLTSVITAMLLRAGAIVLEPIRAAVATRGMNIFRKDIHVELATYRERASSAESDENRGAGISVASLISKV